jgi:hypothetical protein
MTWALEIIGVAAKSKPSRVLPVLGEGGEEAGGGPALLVGAHREGGPTLLDGGQPQVGEDEVEAGGVDGLGHAASPTSLLKRAS